MTKTVNPCVKTRRDASIGEEESQKESRCQSREIYISGQRSRKGRMPGYERPIQYPTNDCRLRENGYAWDTGSPFQDLSSHPGQFGNGYQGT
jgi:hypothetical protein